jgi:hypothetical protein
MGRVLSFAALLLLIGLGLAICGKDDPKDSVDARVSKCRVGVFSNQATITVVVTVSKPLSHASVDAGISGAGAASEVSFGTVEFNSLQPGQEYAGTVNGPGDTTRGLCYVRVSEASV